MIRVFSFLLVLYISSSFGVSSVIASELTEHDHSQKHSHNQNTSEVESKNNLVATEGSFRAPIPGMMNSVGYLQLTNTTNKDLTLVGAKSSVAKRVEFHDHEMKNGVMRMFKVNSLTIKAKATLAFESGGLHLMFLGLNEIKSDQKTILVELVADNGNVIPVHLQVKSIHHQHSHH